MAHLVGTKGPYPDKAGEFCGNHHPDFEATPLLSLHETPRQAQQRQFMYLLGMQFGKPSNCKAGTSEEMAARGYVGLYLKEDRKLLSWETSIETNELTEAVVSKTPEGP